MPSKKAKRSDQNPYSNARLVNLGLPTDVVDIGRSIAPLSDEQRERVAAVRTERKSRLEQISSEYPTHIGPGPARIARKALTDEYTTVKLQLEACDSLLSTLRRIPLEILGEILLFYVDMPPENMRLTGSLFRTINSAETIGQVSLLWRHAVCSTSAIHSPLTIVAVESDSVTEPKFPTHLLATHLFHLDMLKNRPWRLHLDARKNYRGGTRPPQELQNLADIFAHPSMSSLAKLTLRTRSPFDMSALSLPSLESINLQWPHPGAVTHNADGSITPRVAFKFPPMPRLSKGVFAPIPIFFFELNLSRLTHLQIGGDGWGLDPSLFVRVMERCTNMKKGRFGIMEEVQLVARQAMYFRHLDTKPRASTIDQPYLEELTLCIEMDHDTNTPSVQVRWPALKKLRCFLSGTNVQSSPFLWGTLPWKSLTSLVLMGAYGTEMITLGVLLPVLDVSNSLEELFLHINAVNTDNLLRYFIAKPLTSSNAVTPLPRLKALGFFLAPEVWEAEPDDERTHDFPIDALVQIVASRTRTAHEGIAGLLQSLVVRLGFDFLGEKPGALLVEELKARLKPFTISKDTKIAIIQTDLTESHVDSYSWTYQWHHWQDSEYSSNVNGETEATLSPLADPKLCI